MTDIFTTTDYHYFTLANLVEQAKQAINSENNFKSHQDFCKAIQHFITDMSKHPELHKMGVRRFSVKNYFKKYGSYRLYEELADFENDIFQNIHLSTPQLFKQYKNVCEYILKSKSYNLKVSEIILNTSFNLLKHNRNKNQNLYPLETNYNALCDYCISPDLLKANIYTADFMINVAILRDKRHEN